MYLDNTMIPTVLLNPHQFAHIGSGCQSSGACTWLTSLTSELLSDRRLSLGELHPEVGVLQLEEESGRWRRDTHIRHRIANVIVCQKICNGKYIKTKNKNVTTKCKYQQSKNNGSVDTLPSVSVLCLTSGGALLLRSSGFGLVLMSFFIFHLRVGSETAHAH